MSFDVEPGETFVVMGLSGSGKSTLVRCLTRLIEPSAGAVEIDGVDVVGMTSRELGATRRRDWAMVFQHFGLLPHRKVIHNIAYGLEISGVPQRARDARARELIDVVGLTGVEGKYPHELSGGMRQRVGLARALAVRPRLLLLDEPFSALDPLIRTDLQDQLLGLARDAEQTSVFITHDLSEALKMGDRIAIMRDGRLVQVGTPEEIVLHPHDDYVRRFAQEAPRAKVVRAGSVLAGAPVLAPTQSVAEASELLARSGASSAVVDGPTPFAVTSSQLQWAGGTNRSVGDLRTGDYATVSSDAVLTEVMRHLVATRNPVLVSSDGVVVGAVTDGDVVRALGVTE